ncbi:MAG: SprT family protein [Lactobacillales bacterium]|nr:SprT family protein [Lactobacillales bacterium]
MATKQQNWENFNEKKDTVYDDAKLQKKVEEVSLEAFGKPFEHRARFNTRLQTSGGRLILSTSDIEINPKSFTTHGESELIAIIKHELTHYHLHQQDIKHTHASPEFKELLDEVGGTRYSKAVKAASGVVHVYQCTKCDTVYHRQRKIDLNKYLCGNCKRKLRFLRTEGI